MATILIPSLSAVVQIAKSEGLRVIASAGSDEKVAFAKELGADIAFNYKTKDTKEALAEVEGGIDIYWDNVRRIFFLSYSSLAAIGVIFWHYPFLSSIFLHLYGIRSEVIQYQCDQLLLMLIPWHFPGEMLEAAFDVMNINGRAIECGMISGYNTAPYHIKVCSRSVMEFWLSSITHHFIHLLDPIHNPFNAVHLLQQNLFLIIGKRLSINGFLVSDHTDLITEFYEDFPARVATGTIKHKEHIYKGLVEAGKGIVDVQRGLNKAKAVVVLDAQ